MAHLQQQIFVRDILKLIHDSNFQLDSVLEFGSYDRDGSVRKLFDDNLFYLGVDIVSGLAVDLVYDGKNLNLNRNFSICIACEVFEHDINWVSTFRNMINYSEEGGLVLFTCASKGRVEHGTPRSVSKIKSLEHIVFSNYYKNLSAKEFEENFNLDLIFKEYFFYYHDKSQDLYFFGVKRSKNPQTNFNFENFIENLKINLLINEKKLETSKNSLLGLLKKFFNFIDLPVRKALLIGKNEKPYQNYMVSKFRIKDFLKRKILRKT